MEARPAGPEAVAERGADRAGEAHAKPGRTPAQACERRRAGDAVDGEVRPALEAPQRRFGVRAEAAVDRAAREPVRLEEELERRHVPADAARPEEPAAERVAAEAPER